MATENPTFIDDVPTKTSISLEIQSFPQTSSIIGVTSPIILIPYTPI